MRPITNRAGFALPLVVIFLVVLSFALAASLAATAAENTTSTAQRGEEKAYQIAEMGLQRFIVSRDSICGVAGSSCLPDPGAATAGQEDSVQFSTTGGYAVVVSRLLRVQQGIKDTVP